METQANPQGGFQSLPFPVRNFSAVQGAHYRVYSTPTEHVEVEAESAVQAYAASGVPDPWRIVRDIPGQRNLIDREKFLEAAKAEPAAETPATAEAAPTTAEAAPAAAETPPQA